MTGSELAVHRLEAALAEQARLTLQYDRAIGTSAELSSFSRLQTANLRVGLCQRAVDSAKPDGAFAFSIAGGVDAPAEARDRVADGLNGSLDDVMRETLRLLVSEVTTNCVQHAHADLDARIDVAVSLPPGAVRVELSTAGAPFEAPADSPVRPGPQDQHGRGLFIVDSLARAWGADRNGSNQVWFELATADDD
jgi:anti-sigma regulatory factor (Ser/Thr protein kinase)